MLPASTCLNVGITAIYSLPALLRQLTATEIKQEVVRPPALALASPLGDKQTLWESTSDTSTRGLGTALGGQERMKIRRMNKSSLAFETNESRQKSEEWRQVMEKLLRGLLFNVIWKRKLFPLQMDPNFIFEYNHRNGDFKKPSSLDFLKLW